MSADEVWPPPSLRVAAAALLAAVDDGDAVPGRNRDVRQDGRVRLTRIRAVSATRAVRCRVGRRLLRRLTIAVRAAFLPDRLALVDLRQVRVRGRVLVARIDHRDAVPRRNRDVRQDRRVRLALVAPGGLDRVRWLRRSCERRAGGERQHQRADASREYEVPLHHSFLSSLEHSHRASRRVQRDAERV